MGCKFVFWYSFHCSLWCTLTHYYSQISVGEKWFKYTSKGIDLNQQCSPVSLSKLNRVQWNLTRCSGYTYENIHCQFPIEKNTASIQNVLLHCF